MKTVTTFGEVMLRISPENKGERLTQSNIFRIEPGGSESNVSIAIKNLGIPTSFVTKLPSNELSEKAIQFLQQFNVDTSKIVKQGNKLGIYWTENGIGPRNSNVIYDRENTSFSEVKAVLCSFKLRSIMKQRFLSIKSFSDVKQGIYFTVVLYWVFTMPLASAGTTNCPMFTEKMGAGR